MAAVYGGEISLLVSGTIIALFRIIIFGISFSSLIATITIILITLSFLAILTLKRTKLRKWVLLTSFSLAVSSLDYIILLNRKTNLVYLLISYWIFTTIISIVSYYYISYCIEANSLFRKLQIESTKDFLTGLNNVRKFDESFNLAVYNSRKKQVGLSLLMIDIDLFKKVNDTYGHQAGDFILKGLGEILLESCGDYNVVSRIGGEEFTVIILDSTKGSAAEIAETIRKNVEIHDFMLITGEHIKITVSIGVSNYPETSDDYDKLLEKSDISLYSAKRKGRNRVISE
jgi:diguanylate cyclase